MKTKREIIFELTEQGKSCKEIQRLTGISLPTIYQYKAEYNKKHTKKREVVKGCNKNRTLCKTCIYRARDFSVNRCDYIDIEKHSRGCPVEDCDKYIKGPRATRKNDITYSDKEPSWKKRYHHEINGCLFDDYEFFEEDFEKWNTRKPMQEIVERLEEEQDDCVRFGGMWRGYDDAIEIVKEVGGMNA